MSGDILGNSWNISKQGLEIITDNNTVKDKNIILKNALDADLKEIGSPILAKETTKGSLSQVVLQIQKIRNISAPKANEDSQAAPRMLKLVLTDGESYIQAIEISPIQSINRNTTPPGTKILIKSAKIASNYLLLDSNSCTVLGGKVPALVEKWELAKNVHTNLNRQNSSSDGPPAWVNFGCKIATNLPDKPFKSLDNKDSKDTLNPEFEAQRQGAIAEAAAGAVKKVFGGGTKQYTAPPITTYKKNYDNPVKDNRRNFKGKSLSGGDKDLDERPQKMPERISLFDFLEDKLPTESSSANVGDNFSTQKPYSSGNRNGNPSVNSFNNRQGFSSNSNQNSYTPRNSYQQNPRSNISSNYNGNQNSRPVKKYDSYKNQNNRSAPIPEQKNNNDLSGLGNSLEKMTLNTNSQFASRSLRQHLNLAPNNNPQQRRFGGQEASNNFQGTEQKKFVQESNSNSFQGAAPTGEWKIGEECLAKYWEDGKYYTALITAITEKTCVVQFKGYGNLEEVLKHDCLPAGSHRGNDGGRRPYTGSMEFRRSSKNYNSNRRQ